MKISIHWVVFGVSIRSKVINNLRISNLGEYQPTIIPAVRASRIFIDERLGFVKALRAEGIISCHATKLTEKIVGIDVICPSVSQGLPNFRRIKGSEEPLYTAKIGNDVDFVRLKGVDELRLLTLKKLD